MAGNAEDVRIRINAATPDEQVAGSNNGRHYTSDHLDPSASAAAIRMRRTVTLQEETHGKHSIGSTPTILRAQRSQRAGIGSREEKDDIAHAT